ncbi:pentapeptide repeat-containing protein [Alkaliphilus peptidifermentans]|uniref:Pentapeptide repeat-containing protein n=1 Tax=Alkaliphilus peptidifermentans DSM 18978 TaxID=1120976 RepID=A0A1G5H0B8_9FIRM|nr:pentapeptide repeat-containing protein [Alkaliphilus peptidifermentans]SCY56358.1 Pentapeptide repeat-containing protein [Alkaliphilus peptidifermentans DSM 18978]
MKYTLKNMDKHMLSENHQQLVAIANEGGNLTADCENCFGLCCVALCFPASEGFPIDKNAGQPCPNLQADFRCCIYKSLNEQGLKGCTAFDCFGAGQKVCQYSYNGHDWRKFPQTSQEMFEVFQIMRQLHELLWYLTDALSRQSIQSKQDIHESLKAMLVKTGEITHLTPKSLMEFDVTAHRVDVNKLLLKTSEYVRAKARRQQKSSTKRQKTFGGKLDLVGADLRKTDMRGENLRGAYLIAADLRGVDLSGADVIGADLRDADLRGADLRNSLFLTQAQINMAIGDINTMLPLSLTPPTSWLIKK